MEQSLPQLHQSCRPTTNKNFQRTCVRTNNCTQRGNIAVFSVVWFALTALGCVAIARTTQTTVLRADAQFIADAVALAYADHGATRAEFLARTLGVTISSSTRDAQGLVTLEVRGRGFRATATAG